MNQMNIREIFVAKEHREKNKLRIYNQVLERVHVKIKNTTKFHPGNTFCYFIVPDFILGIPSYNQAELVDFIKTSLEKNGFKIYLTPPNMLLIAWFHYSSDYEITRKLIKEEKMAKLEEMRREQEEAEAIPVDIGVVNRNKGAYVRNVTEYTPQSGLVYSSNILEKLKEKMDSLKKI